MRRLLAFALLCLTATAVTAHAQTSPSLRIIPLTGNSTGTYSAPGVLSTSQLLFGFAANEDLVAGSSADGTPFNFSPTNVALTSSAVNSTSGWKPQTNQIIDPTATDWTGYTIVWEVADNLGGGGGGGGGVAFTCGSGTNVVLCFDPSDSTTVFTNTACTTPAVATNTVACIKDKSATACNAKFLINPPTLNNVGGVWSLDSASGTDATAVLTSCAAGLLQNVGYVSIHGASQSSQNAQTVLAMWSINGNAAAKRLGCGIDADSTAGSGYGLRGRRLDTDAGQNLVVGSLNSAALVVRCQVSYATAAASVFVNNSSAASTGTFQTAGNTSNTTSDGVFMLGTTGGDVTNVPFNGKFYGIVVVTPPTGFTSQEAAIDTYLCTKAGLTC